MGRYEKNPLCLVINFYKSILNELNIGEISKDCTYNLNHVFAAYCLRVAYFASYKNDYLGFDFVPSIDD